MTQVAIFIGSASDDPIVGACAKVLKQLGISYRYTITSAHRTPERTAQLMDELEAEGVQVYICAAGMLIVESTPFICTDSISNELPSFK